MNKRTLSFFIVAVVSMLLLTTCGPSRNPPLNSVITAHGNTDWHIDTAQEFIDGTDMNGNLMASNFVPNTWTKRHMHVGDSNTENFYYDVDKISSGADTDSTSGIETAMLFFYAGHGGPVSWSTLGSSATQANMSLGDYPGRGKSRYYWQCSCEVFAHGPKTCTGASWVYACPAKFNGSPDSDDHRNVYERWGPVLSPDLRMACGVSTDAFCHDEQTNKIWNNYNNNSFDVADSFIDGLNWSGVVPLCITLGGSNVTSTPLYDLTFTNLPNSSGSSYYHIQYLSKFARQSTAGPIVEIPDTIPVLRLGPLPEPDPLQGIEFRREDNWLISPETIDGRGPRVRINSLSGSVYIQGPRLLDLQKPPLSEEEYLELANRHIQEQGWAEGKTFTEPSGIAMMLSSVPAESTQQETSAIQKNVIMTFKRTIDVKGLAVNVLGEGGVMRVQMNNDGSLLNASIVWREAVEVMDEVPIKTFDEALAEATTQLDDPASYKLDQWNWGYKEESGNVEQTELHIVFQFSFVPIDPELVQTDPPRLVEIAGER